MNASSSAATERRRAPRRPSAEPARRLARTLLFAALAAVAATGAMPGPAAAASTPATWAATAALQTDRAFHNAVLLGDGSVIAAGGQDGLSWTATAERWTPGTGAWAAAPSLPQSAAGQAAVRLADGRALFAGGSNATSYHQGASVFDPATGRWSSTGPMTAAHAYGAGALVEGGDVIVVGGYDGAAAGASVLVDRYSVAARTWSAAAPLPGTGRFALTATTLADGRVLVAGGDSGTASGGSTLATVQIYDPVGNAWSAGPAMSRARFDHAAVRLADGRVLVAGGSDAQGRALSGTEVFDPSTGRWSTAGNLIVPRYGLTLSLLADGRVLAAGGYQSSSAPALSSAEIYDPSTAGWSLTGSLATGRRYHAATALADGRVLVSGGIGASGGTIASAEVFTPPAARAVYPKTTFHPLAPQRILDTRSGLGLSGAFAARAPRWIQVTGRAGVPAGAVAVTGNLTVTGQTSGGYVALGPVSTATPASSTLNFPAADNRANNVTVALSSDGRLSAVYIPSTSAAATTQLLLDITGYYAADATGATFKAMDPVRVLDSRSGLGLSGTFATGVGRQFQVAASARGIPLGAVAVTGNLTVVGQTSKGYAYVGPTLPADLSKLTTSTVNVPAGDIRANGVTVPLGTGGRLFGVWIGTAGSKAHLVFDVTGYYLPDATGARFVPLEPVRLVDSRYNQGATGPIVGGTPVSPRITARGHIPTDAVAITGNATVVGQTKSGYVTVGRHLTGSTASTSTINFSAGDTRANGFAVSVWTDGTIGLLYVPAATPATTQLIVDVAGYFAP